jgi:antibiotic biosynthesis monooxygenase (ABM) superfamily enzyme
MIETRVLRHDPPPARPVPVRPPGKHEFAIIVWLCVFPTLTVLNLALGDWLRTLPPVGRTFVLATLAVPVISYGVMPLVQRLRASLLRRYAR